MPVDNIVDSTVDKTVNNVIVSLDTSAYDEALLCFRGCQMPEPGAYLLAGSGSNGAAFFDTGPALIRAQAIPQRCGRARIPPSYGGRPARSPGAAPAPTRSMKCPWIASVV